MKNAYGLIIGGLFEDHDDMVTRQVQHDAYQRQSGSRYPFAIVMRDLQ